LHLMSFRCFGAAKKTLFADCALRSVHHPLRLLTSASLSGTMPKATSSLPMSGLFGVVKPSGPTSMSILEDMKPLVASSKLFVEERDLKKVKGKTKKAKHTRYAVKIGQGGTLDPLADGVLGELSHRCDF